MKRISNLRIYCRATANQFICDSLRHFNKSIVFLDEQQEVKTQLLKKPCIIIVDMLQDTECNNLLIQQATFESIPVIRIFPESSNIENLVAELYRAQGDCIKAPFDETQLLLSIERCSITSRLLNRLNYQHKQIQKSQTQLKISLKALETDQKAGHLMQKISLPKSPMSFKQFTIEHTIIPSLYLSGDFVNYQTALNRFLIFFLTDVSGHGSSSAFVTFMMKQLMTRILKKHIRNKDFEALEQAPRGFVERLNEDILEGNLEKHLTVFAGSIDTEKNLLKYIVGAHMPPPIIACNGEISILQGTGLPIGLYSNQSWEINEIKLPNEHYTIYSFSDGIYEKLPGNSMKEKEHLLIEAITTCPPRVDAILKYFNIDPKEAPPDDIAICIINKN